VNIDDLGTYSDGYLHGATWAINHTTNQLEQRDERLARRIVALQYDHDHPLDPNTESWIDRNVRIWAASTVRASLAGPTPTYEQCMASWDDPT
jgi:hypothetical protein